MQRPPVRGLPASARLCCPPPWPLPCCPGPSASFGLKPVPLPDPSSDPFSSRSPLRPRDGPPASRSAPGWSGGVWLHLGGPALTFLPAEENEGAVVSPWVGRVTTGYKGRSQAWRHAHSVIFVFILKVLESVQ